MHEEIGKGRRTGNNREGQDIAIERKKEAMPKYEKRIGER